MRLASLLGTFLVACLAAPAVAQEPETATRASLIEQAQAEKAATLQPYTPGAAEKYLDYAQNYLTGGQLHWHPFFESAYAGGGFTLGAGYLQHIGSYNVLDLRGSYHVQRLQADRGGIHRAGRCSGGGSICPCLADGERRPRSVSSALGNSTSKESRVNYGFKQPYGSAAIDIVPIARSWCCAVASRSPSGSRRQGPGACRRSKRSTHRRLFRGSARSPPISTPKARSGSTRARRPGYARRGGFYGVTFHDFTDPDNAYGFTQVDYEAIQHIPLLREAWVLSFRGLVETTHLKSDQQVPFFMLPSIGGGSTCAGFSSWRFRDRNSLLLQA